MRYSILFASLLVAGCVPENTLKVDSPVQAKIVTVSCEGRSSGRCDFINSPVKLSDKKIELPGREFPFSYTEEDLEFIDAKERQWVAPKGTFTDGASIPGMFVKVIGDPRSKEFINAATVHDAYCATGNEKGAYYHTATWQNVHRMFYDALRAGGTPAIKAKTMYAGVYLGGPRWVGARPAPSTKRARIRLLKTNSRLAANSLSASPHASSYLAGGSGYASMAALDAVLVSAVSGGDVNSGLRSLQSNKPLARAGVSRARLIRAFKQAKAYIEANNPPIDELESFLTSKEQEVTRTRTRTKTNAFTQHEGDGGEGDGGNGY